MTTDSQSLAQASRLHWSRQTLITLTAELKERHDRAMGFHYKHEYISRLVELDLQAYWKTISITEQEAILQLLGLSYDGIEPDLLYAVLAREDTHAAVVGQLDKKKRAQLRDLVVSLGGTLRGLRYKYELINVVLALQRERIVVARKNNPIHAPSQPLRDRPAELPKRPPPVEVRRVEHDPSPPSPLPPAGVSQRESRATVLVSPLAPPSQPLPSAHTLNDNADWMADLKHVPDYQPQVGLSPGALSPSLSLEDSTSDHAGEIAAIEAATRDETQRFLAALAAHRDPEYAQQMLKNWLEAHEDLGEATPAGGSEDHPSTRLPGAYPGPPTAVATGESGNDHSSQLPGSEPQAQSRPPPPPPQPAGPRRGATSQTAWPTPGPQVSFVGQTTDTSATSVHSTNPNALSHNDIQHKETKAPGGAPRSRLSEEWPRLASPVDQNTTITHASPGSLFHAVPAGPSGPVHSSSKPTGSRVNEMVDKLGGKTGGKIQQATPRTQLPDSNQSDGAAQVSDYTLSSPSLSIKPVSNSPKSHGAPKVETSVTSSPPRPRLSAALGLFNGNPSDKSTRDVKSIDDSNQHDKQSASSRSVSGDTKAQVSQTNSTHSKKKDEHHTDKSAANKGSAAAKAVKQAADKTTPTSPRGRANPTSNGANPASNQPTQKPEPRNEPAKSTTTTDKSTITGNKPTAPRQASVKDESSTTPNHHAEDDWIPDLLAKLEPEDTRTANSLAAFAQHPRAKGGLLRSLKSNPEMAAILDFINAQPFTDGSGYEARGEFDSQWIISPGDATTACKEFRKKLEKKYHVLFK